MDDHASPALDDDRSPGAVSAPGAGPLETGLVVAIERIVAELTRQRRRTSARCVSRRCGLGDNVAARCRLPMPRGTQIATMQRLARGLDELAAEESPGDGPCT